MVKVSGKKNTGVGFLLLSGPYHAHHCAPIAYELSKDESLRVTIYYQSQDTLRVLNELARIYPHNQVILKHLGCGAIERIRMKIRGRTYPRTRVLYKKHKNELSSNEVLVSSSFGISYLRKISAYENSKLVMCFHGAGDGGIANIPWDTYDLLLVSGEKYKDFLLKQNHLLADKIENVGYVKFEGCTSTPKKDYIFKNNNPTVLYNPHHNLKYSSLYCWGDKIFDYFAKNCQYNLIIAPHVLIYNRNLGLVKEIKSKVSGFKNIFFTENSDLRCFNMQLIKQSDLYLGEYSSQVYEFLEKPKACLFLNPNKVAWQKNQEFTMWKMGNVVTDFSNFEHFLEKSFKNPAEFSKDQEKLLAYTFRKKDGLAAFRATTAIKQLLQSENPSPK